LALAPYLEQEWTSFSRSAERPHPAKYAEKQAKGERKAGDLIRP
jgi:hypothetical protein